jgi:hypothetical protein
MAPLVSHTLEDGEEILQRSGLSPSLHTDQVSISDWGALANACDEYRTGKGLPLFDVSNKSLRLD